MKEGDKLTIDNGSDRWEVIVRGISGTRGPAPVARQLYEETEKSVQMRENDKEARRLYREPGSMIKGRPTKRDRRLIGRVGRRNRFWICMHIRFHPWLLDKLFQSTYARACNMSKDMQ